jgi:hypothetical protein
VIFGRARLLVRVVKNPILPGSVSASLYKPADEEFVLGQNHTFLPMGEREGRTIG